MWKGSDRRSELPEDWAEIRRVVIRRALGRCEALLPSGLRCPRGGVDVDHKYAPDDHRPQSLQFLCTDHHKRKTQGEARRGRLRSPRKRAPEPHPGDRSR